MQMVHQRCVEGKACQSTGTEPQRDIIFTYLMLNEAFLLKSSRFSPPRQLSWRLWGRSPRSRVLNSFDVFLKLPLDRIPQTTATSSTMSEDVANKVAYSGFMLFIIIFIISLYFYSALSDGWSWTLHPLSAVWGKSTLIWNLETKESLNGCLTMNEDSMKGIFLQQSLKTFNTVNKCRSKKKNDWWIFPKCKLTFTNQLCFIEPSSSIKQIQTF